MIKGGPYILILCVIGLALLAGGIGGRWEQFSPSAYKSSVEPVRPGQEDAIKRAVFAQERLWLLSDAGELWTVKEDAPKAERVALKEPVLDICIQDGQPVVVTSPRSEVSLWTLRAWSGSSWITVATADPEGEGLVSLQCAPGGLTLLTSGRLIEARGLHQTTVDLSNRVPSQPANTVLATPTHFFVGLNAGEWGGGLQRIDRRTGQVVALERNISGDLCGGPLNPSCDPVNGVVVLPWKPGCVVAAVGLVHMRSRGRLVEVCGEQIDLLHHGPCPYPDEQPDRRGGKDNEPRCTEAFFGIVPRSGGLMVVGSNGLSTLDRNGHVERAPLPAFKAYRPFDVSFAKDIVFVRSSANQRHSLSGYTPLMVAR